METINYNKRVIGEARKANEEKFKTDSKKRLVKNIEKKFQTTMIGSLSSFENVFGELWGHGKTDENLTDEEIYWRAKWEVVRTEVLNNGNHQLRGAIEEVMEYTMTWNRYKTEFILKKNL